MNSDNTSTTSSKQPSIASSSSSIKSSKSKKSKSSRSKTRKNSSSNNVKSSSSSTTSSKKKNAIPPSSPQKAESNTTTTAKAKTGNSSLTARANEYMKRNKEKKLQQQQQKEVPESPKKEVSPKQLASPKRPIKKSNSVPSSPIPTSMRIIPTTPTTNISQSANNTPNNKKLPILTPSIFSESPLPPKTVVKTPLIPFDDEITTVKKEVEQTTSFYTPTVTSFYTPSEKQPPSFYTPSEKQTTTYSYYSNTTTETPTTYKQSEEKETITISYENIKTPLPSYEKKVDLTLTTTSSTTTDLMTSFDNTPTSQATAPIIRKLAESFSSEEEQIKPSDTGSAAEGSNTGSAAAFFLDDLEHINDDDSDKEANEFLDNFDINSPDEENEHEIDTMEDKEEAKDIKPSKEDDESTNIIINAKNKSSPKKKPTVLKDLIMSMEKTEIEEGVEIYDTEYYIRSIVYAVQSAEEAQQLRDDVKNEWVTGSKKPVEDDECSISSIDTQARMNVINEIAFQTISSFATKQTEKKILSPPKFSKYEQENIPSQKVLQYLKSKMKLPKRSIADLLNAILGPENKWSRKKNACGAFKFLCMKHSKGMAYTHGVLSTIACVFNVSGSIESDVLKLSFNEKEDELQAYYDARSRIVLAFIHLCKCVKNRILIVHTPGLIQSMIKVLQQTNANKLFVGDSQQGICECFALLAKTRENRISLLQQVHGQDLVSSLTNVISIHTSCPNIDIGIMGDDDTVETMNSTNDDDDSSLASSYDSTIDQTLSNIENNNTDILSQTSTHDADDESSADSNSTSSSTTSSSSLEDDEETLLSDKTANEEIELVVDLKAKKKKNKQMVMNNDKFRKYYDTHGNHYLNGARVHTFAALLHLANNKVNAYSLCRDNRLITSLIEVSTIYNSKSHTKAIMTLAYLTRLHYNNHQMVFLGSMSNKIISTFVSVCHYSTDVICKLYACYAIMNLSYDKTCRQELAIIPGLLNGLKLCCLEHNVTNDTSIDIDDLKEEEYEYYQAELKLSAIRALCNLCDEHANIIYISNSLDCIPTIIALSQQGMKKRSNSDLVSFIASDCLAYLSRSLTSISDNGMMLCVEERKMSMVNLPSFETTHWEQWE